MSNRVYELKYCIDCIYKANDVDSAPCNNCHFGNKCTPIDTSATSSTHTNDTNLNYNFQKLIESIPKPPKVILSKYIQDEYSMYYLPATSTDEQDIYHMNPKCARKIMAMYPNLKYYISNIELL